MSQTSIQWTDRVWNPVTGCTKVSPGCAHCYAEGVAKRFFAKQYPPVLSEGCLLKTRPRVFTDVMTHEERLVQPLRWRKPRKIFVNSMSDLFHDDVPDAFIDQVFAVMALSPQHTFQVLTKRADRMRVYLLALTERLGDLWDLTNQPTWITLPSGRSFPRWPENWPLPNVWLGVSVENQQHADDRIPLLTQTPAAIRFVSAEPLLGPVDFESPVLEVDCEGNIDWVIVGGESGHKARPCAIEWIEHVIRQCESGAVPVFVKQMGAHVVSEERTVTEELLDTLKPKVRSRFLKAPNGEYWGWRAGLTDKHGADVAQWPEYLTIREFPR